MEAGKVVISGIFQKDRLLEIPFYQREYVWGEDQWAQFVSDMEYVSQTRRPYFLGSIILKRMSTPHIWEDDVAEEWTVIDGQQRLSTILIYFKALTLLTGKSDKFGDFMLGNGKAALLPGFADAPEFDRIIEQDKPEKLDPSESGSKMVEAFNYFIDEIDVDHVSLMAIKGNVQMVCIEVAEGEDEQQIFDTINSRGVRLTTAELLKNYFFDRTTVDDYRKYWKAVFETDPEARAYWGKDITTGRITRTIIDLFFDSFLQIKAQQRKYNVSADDKKRYERVDQIFNSYKHFIENYYGGVDEKMELVHELKPYADAFRAAFDPEVVDRAVSRDPGTDRLSAIAFGLRTTTMIPYVLYVLNAVDDQGERDSICDILESYLMRRTVTRETTKNYNRLFNSLILNEVCTADGLREFIAAQDDATTRMPSDDDVRRAFHEETRYTNLYTRAILYMVESRVRPQNTSTALLGFSRYSLEHLMPKKWRNNWTSPGSKDAERERDQKLLTLGNLAIITQSLNASIRDANWKTKKAGQGYKDGLKKCAGGLVTMDDVLDKAKWTEQDIDDRAATLGDMALSIW